MSGVGIKVDLTALDRLNARIAKLAQLEKRQLLEEIGGAVEQGVTLRISEDKQSPDGAPWPLWSERYALTRHGNHALLESGDDGDPLLETIGFEIDPGNTFVEVGTNKIYAATHQFGDEGRGIPARPYLGLSQSDEEELEDIMDLSWKKCSSRKEIWDMKGKSLVVSLVQSLQARGKGIIKVASGRLFIKASIHKREEQRDEN